jgi:antitoxin CptB
MAKTETIENRRKRLRFRSWHRGTKEMDLLIGSFADAHLAAFGSDQLDRFEALLDVPEPVVYDWILGRGDPPDDYNHDVMKLLLAFEFSPPGRG